MNKTQIKCPKTEEAESIEQMLRRLTANKQPIPDNVPELYTPKADGVLPNTDIRTDRFDIAAQAKDKWDKSEIAKVQNKATSVKTWKREKRSDYAG